MFQKDLYGIEIMIFHSQSYLFRKTKEFLIFHKFYNYSVCSNFKKPELINPYLPEDSVYLQDNFKSHHLYLLRNSAKFFFGKTKLWRNGITLHEDQDFNIIEIGHALHDLNPVFNEFSRKRSLAILVTS